MDLVQNLDRQNRIAKKRYRILAFLMDFIIFISIG